MYAYISVMPMFSFLLVSCWDHNHWLRMNWLGMVQLNLFTTWKLAVFLILWNCSVLLTWEETSVCTFRGAPYTVPHRTHCYLFFCSLGYFDFSNNRGLLVMKWWTATVKFCMVQSLRCVFTFDCGFDHMNNIWPDVKFHDYNGANRRSIGASAIRLLIGIQLWLLERSNFTLRCHKWLYCINTHSLKVLCTFKG